MKTHVWFWSTALILSAVLLTAGGCVDRSSAPVPAPIRTAASAPQQNAQSAPETPAGNAATAQNANGQGANTDPVNAPPGGTSEPAVPQQKKPQTKPEVLEALADLESRIVRNARAGKLEESHRLAVQAGDMARELLETQGELDAEEKEFLGKILCFGARGYAHTERLEDAVAALKGALELGFTETHVVAKHKGFDGLRARDDFKELLPQLESQAAEAAKKEAAAAKLEAAETLAKGETFDFNFELRDPDNKAIKLGDFAGKVVIVDFWGTWCPPCREEIPHFVELLKKHKEAGLEIVGINYENGDAETVKSTIKTFVKEQGIPYLCVIGDEKTQDMVPNLDGFPTTLFLDRSGKVRAKVVGARSLMFLETIVTALLEEKTGE